jgi:hypothetical protein
MNRSTLYTLAGVVFIVLVIVGALLVSSYLDKTSTPEDITTATSTEDVIDENDNDGTPTENADVILENPESNERITSPLKVTGKARGGWFFEASFPIKLLDGNGKQLAVSHVQAQGEWMTSDYVPFEGTLTFPTPTTADGTLVLEKDNPSGLPENAKEIRIPVRFNANSQATTRVNLFYPNSNQGDDACDPTSVASVKRSIPTTPSVLADTIKLLIEGKLTQAEKTAGFSTEFPKQGFVLKGANIKDRTAILEFSEVPGFTSGGACRIGLLRASIEETAMQFTGVDKVEFRPVDIFQP